jgi:hypothetical protein
MPTDESTAASCKPTIVKSWSVPCKEKERLLALYKNSVFAHAAVVSELTITRGKTPKREHDALWASAEKTRSDTEVLRLELYRHKQEHGC